LEYLREFNFSYAGHRVDSNVENGVSPNVNFKAVKVEFTRQGKTYFCIVGFAAEIAPPDLLAIAFRPCAFKAPFKLELSYLGHDSRRGIELYQPIESDPGDED
jgi:hypothetical protein